jgi:hypothetical protein
MYKDKLKNKDVIACRSVKSVRKGKKLSAFGMLNAEHHSAVADITTLRCQSDSL